MRARIGSRILLLCLCAGLASSPLAASIVRAEALPPVPVPNENPITEEKRVLGKILFWEEQLSSDDTVACGTCHRPGVGTVDSRRGHHPGHDTIPGTDDDVLGSPGIARADASGHSYPDPLFGLDVQVTDRASQPFVGSQWSPELFWDGRASGAFVDPETGELLIPEGGALENQALGPILSDVEMAFEERTWDDVRGKLQAVEPLRFAADIPVDVVEALAANPSYPELFTSAFGDEEITASRIAFAIATYERTLVPDQTPFDRYHNGDDGALTEDQRLGMLFFHGTECITCHELPHFTDHSFRNIGLRPPEEDLGRAKVTGDPKDRGRFKVPPLRNVALRDRLMHTGQILDLADALRFYAKAGHEHFAENQDPLVQGGIVMAKHSAIQLLDFFVNGLTDPRVANESFPFDRPVLRSERPSSVDGGLPSVELVVGPNPFRDEVSMTFDHLGLGTPSVSIYSTAGRLVRRVFGSESSRGPVTLRWDGNDRSGLRMPAGVYLFRIEAGGAARLGESRVVLLD